MKKILMPALIVAMGAGAAFAGNLVSKSAKAIPTYRIDAQTLQCVPVDQDCDEGGSFVCKWDAGDGSQLHRVQMSETQCSQELTRSFE